MSYVYKCDRCGKIMDKSSEGCGRIVVKEVTKKYLPQEGTVFQKVGIFDLCPECKMQFNSWLFGNTELVDIEDLDELSERKARLRASSQIIAVAKEATK